MRQSQRTIFLRAFLSLLLAMTGSLTAFAQFGSYPDGTRRNPKDQPTQRWLPLPQDFSSSAPPLQQLQALQELQTMLQGAGRATVSDLSEDQLRKMEETFKNWQNNNSGTEGLPDLSSIPPGWIDRAIKSPQMRKQAHQMLEDYARKRKLPQADAGGSGRPILPPRNRDVRSGQERTGNDTQQKPDSRGRGFDERDWNQPSNRYRPPARGSSNSNSLDRNPFEPAETSQFPRGRTNPLQPDEPTLSPDVTSGQEIQNPFDMLPENREELSQVPEPTSSGPNGENNSQNRGPLQGLSDLIGNKDLEDLLSGDLARRGVDQDQIRRRLEDNGLGEAMQNGSLDSLLNNKSFQDVMQNEELKEALRKRDLGTALGNDSMQNLLRDPNLQDTVRSMMRRLGEDDGNNSSLPNELQFQPRNTGNPDRSASNGLPQEPNAQQQDALRRLMDQLARDNNLPTSSDLARRSEGRQDLGNALPESKGRQSNGLQTRSEDFNRLDSRSQPQWDPNRSLADRSRRNSNTRPWNSPAKSGRQAGSSRSNLGAEDGSQGSLSNPEQLAEQLRNRLGSSGSTRNKAADSDSLEEVNRRMTEQFSQALRDESNARPNEVSRSDNALSADQKEFMKEFLGRRSRAVAESLRAEGNGGSSSGRSKNSERSSLKDLIGDADPDSIKKLVESKGFGNTIQAIVDNTLDREKKGPSKSSGSLLDDWKNSRDGGKGKGGSGPDSSEGLSGTLKDTIDRLSGKSKEDGTTTGGSASDKKTSKSSSNRRKQASASKGSLASGGKTGSGDKKSGIGSMFSNALKSVQDSPKTVSPSSSVGSTSGGAGSSVASAASSAANAVGNLEMPSLDGSFLWTLLIFALVIAGIVVAAFWMRGFAGYFDPEQVERRWVQKVLKAGVKTREDVVRAYHSLVLRSSNSVANWWTHRHVAKQLSLEISPQLSTLLQEITNIYEEARYLPPECELNKEQIKCMESAIQQFEAAGA